MKIKALVSFSGALSMARGQITDYGDKYVINDLLRAGYIEAVEEKTDETVKASRRKATKKAG